MSKRLIGFELVLDRLDGYNLTPSGFRDDSYTALCPAHDDNRKSLCIDKDKDTGKTLLCCHAGCETEDVVKALGLEMKDLFPPSLHHAANDRCLEASYRYVDAAGTLKYEVLRYRYTDGTKTFSQRRQGGRGWVWNIEGVERVLYHLLQVTAAVSQGSTVFIVEGEKDVETLESHGFSATTNSGGANAHWKAPMVEPLRDADVVIIPDKDHPGELYANKAMKTLSGVARSVRLLRLDGLPEKGDVSDWFAQGHTAEELRNLVQSLPDSTETPEQVMSDHGLALVNACTLRALAGQICDKLNKGATRSAKEATAKVIADLLLQQDRLLVDATTPNNPMPYAIADDGAAVLVSKENPTFRLALQDAGLNPSEATFHWIAEDLQYRAIREGRHVNLRRYSHLEDGSLYISCGMARMVVARIDGGRATLSVVPNGQDGVLFAADSCLPEWSPTEPKPLHEIAAFRPVLATPAEVAGYTASAQSYLLTCWLIGLLLGITVPLLTAIGSMGSGKSILAKAIVRLMHGPGKDVSNKPKASDHFWAATTGLLVYAIDNLDAEPERWLLDDLAAAVTGVVATSRQYYTNAGLFQKPTTARLIVTTRTATFASRSDITDRILPLFYGELKREDRREENALLAEVDEHRDALLSYLISLVVSFSRTGGNTGGRDSRFQAFARIAETGSQQFGSAYVKAWTDAQVLSVSEHPPLLTAILRRFDSNPMELKGTPSAIYDVLNPLKTMPPMGGKLIARKLRELKHQLKLNGIEMSEGTLDGGATFTLWRSHQPSTLTGKAGNIGF